MGEQVDTPQDTVFFKVTKVVTYKYDYPMTENELYDCRQDAMNEPSRFMSMWANENDATQTGEEIQSISVLDADDSDGDNSWYI
jgi:hypothetical protein